MEYISFLIYPLILLSPFVLYSLFPWVWERYRFAFYFCAFLPIAIFAALRGNAGTDTENYREAFEIFEVSNFSWVSVDPMFNSLMAITKSAGLGFQGFAAIQAALCLLFYSYGGAKLDRAVPVFGLLLLPVLFVDSTFNGMRYGLGFALTTVALYLYGKSVSRARTLFVLAPIAAHSSLAALLFLVPGVIFLVVPLFFLFGVNDFVYVSYLTSKTESYSDFSRPGLFSGLMPILQFLALLLIGRINRIGFTLGLNLHSLAFALFLAGIAASTISYAGLRVLQLSVFIFSISIASNVDVSKRRTTLTIVFVAGLLSVFNFLRQVFVVGPAGGVFFHPYDLFIDFQ